MSRKTAVGHVLELLRREIAEQYAPGDMLPTERELAERFGVARNTMRETMIYLEAYSLIEKTQRGARVRTPGFEPMFEAFTQHFDRSLSAYREVLEFRRIVETGAARAIAAGITDAELAALEVQNARMASALTAHDAAEADFAFHLGLVLGARNAVVQRMYQVMSMPLKFYLEVGKTRKPDTDQAHDQHARIIAAARVRDAAGIAEALNTHFDHSGEVLATQQPAAPAAPAAGERDA
ncbi:FadR family transcriptional regulator (plasmid) [Paroceanicella profunda]|uniref:FadR family transcriptional regulator n=1 Tax=Paroceanicella profunda TaxID=2579971 RepID=A0A5B8G508_9RHOB|nr:FCD domain-containing protein [Paroceanicella profunda]QDL94372.1 FadR family transcriptional regulator [Paroceanicella profunda]